MKKIGLFGALMLGVLLSGHTYATVHALIMTISEYQSGIPPLRGVKYDAQNARAIAHLMGVKDENIREFHDQQLTLLGMAQAFDGLAASVGEGDDVFIYYSGHGGRQYIQQPEERCAESLVTVDGDGFIDSELESKLKTISAKARKVIVLLDACHSGGATSRAISSLEKNVAFTPKYWSKGNADSCSKSINVLTRSITRGINNPGSGAQNYVYIAAAQDNEVSFDQPGKGGVATRSWLKCLEGDARDLDGSGAITADEVRQCAQPKIDLMLKSAEGLRPHHIVIVGNTGAVMKFGGSTAAVSGTPLPAMAVGGGAPSPVAPEAYRTLLDIYNNRDDHRQVTLKSARNVLRIGRDSVEFSLTSTHSGYVYLLMVGSDGKSFDLIFPNKLDSSHYIETGQTLQLPRSSWQIVAGGPKGKDHLLAIVADSPRDFSVMGAKPVGPFSIVEANSVASKDIQLVTNTASAANTQECKQSATKRTLQVKQATCSNSYGAAMLSLDEVE
ncbi:MAG: DUF4384 domain-containing protein [Gallionella sp.]|jgi:hypothetical protein